MKEFLKLKFSKLIPDFIYEGFGDYDSNEIDILYELEKYGITNISELEKIIPDNYMEAVTELGIKFNYLGTLRVILIINDYKKYISNYNEYEYRNFWEIANIKSVESIFSFYNISVDEITNETRERN
ncbi:hypothetical protein [Flavobacterium sp. PL002]|uniref:hypothetical protein n=1 Tax=Flavobacterium sp. PL002 TaxID=1897058 RepID=UPI0017884855|nr:hypothetical protein [Flavobacterium sp. PL002]